MTPSRSAVNRAGEKLALASADDADLPIEACEVAATWRELHAEPLVWLTMSIRGRVETPVSYRLKRLPQIATKLARSGNMALARMQDIGGCRLVVDSQSDVDLALAAVERRAAPHYEVVRVTDYRRDGRQRTGYRAAHVMLRRDGFVIELQIRTRRQHAWAEAVERAANRTGYKLKDGEGPDDLVDYFRVASDCLAELDDGRRPSTELLAQFRAGERTLPTFFRELPAVHTAGFAVKSKTLSTRENNWLLVYDGRADNPSAGWTVEPTAWRRHARTQTTSVGIHGATGTRSCSSDPILRTRFSGRTLTTLADRPMTLTRTACFRSYARRELARGHRLVETT